MPIAVVTGTSTGIGYATSLHLARHGYQVFATMRNPDKGLALSQQASDEGLLIDVIEMDVNSSESVVEAFEGIQNTGPVDVLVNNAGISGSAPLELTTEHEHRAIFETNYFGTVRCIQSVIESMRERQTGSIVNISSAAGLFATPTQIPYSASKWAVECLTEALAHELRPFGVRVLSIEPGVVATSIFENSAERTHYDKQSPYAKIMQRIGRIFATGLKQPATADQVAESILQAITAETFKFRWPVGKDAVQFAKARQSDYSERWINLAASTDEDEYNSEFKKLFGISL